jgi:hypothetical protein
MALTLSLSVAFIKSASCGVKLLWPTPLTHSLDALIQLAMHTGTRNAKKAAHGDVDAGRHAGVTIGAALVGPRCGGGRWTASVGYTI